MTIQKISKNRKNEIIDLAESIANLHHNEPSTNLESIIKYDNIRLIEDDFKEDFEGRSEFIKNKFVIFLNSTNHDTRKRFTLAHELGHCEIPEHREYLLKQKQPYDCKIDFFSNSPIPEQEANIFASAILMPSNILFPLLQDTTPSIQLFQQIAKTLNTSLTATILRCLDLSPYPYGVLFAKNEKIQWSFFNDWMKEINLSYIAPQTSIPQGSSFYRNKEAKIFEGYCNASTWFPNNSDKTLSLKEEFYSFGTPLNNQLILLCLDEN